MGDSGSVAVAVGMSATCDGVVAVGETEETGAGNVCVVAVDNNVGVNVGRGVEDGSSVGAGVGVVVGGKGTRELGSTPGGTMITPGVPSRGGVTTTSAWI